MSDSEQQQCQKGENLQQQQQQECGDESESFFQVAKVKAAELSEKTKDAAKSAYTNVKECVVKDECCKDKQKSEGDDDKEK